MFICFNNLVYITNLNLYKQVSRSSPALFVYQCPLTYKYKANIGFGPREHIIDIMCMYN